MYVSFARFILSNQLYFPSPLVAHIFQCQHNDFMNEWFELLKKKSQALLITPILTLSSLGDTVTN